jgi:hypothetical protein
VSFNRLSGTVPKSFAPLKPVVSIDMSNNLLTGNATMFVEVFGSAFFAYNCFKPDVLPESPHCTGIPQQLWFV